MKMEYFALNTDKRLVVSSYGNEYTTSEFKSEFKKVLEHAHSPWVMTMMVHRWLSFDCDWDKLEEFYNERAKKHDIEEPPEPMKTKADFFVSDYGAGVGHNLFS